jgi:hypothetical protein
MADWLRVRGKGEGARLDVDDELTVGREQPGLGAVADDVEQSRRHASFVRTESGGLAVEDLGSTNGTFVNGKRTRRTGLRRVTSCGRSDRAGSSATRDAQESATPPATPPTKRSPAAGRLHRRRRPVAAPPPGRRSPAAATAPRSHRVSAAAAEEQTSGPGARHPAGAPLAALGLSLFLERDDDEAPPPAPRPAYDGTAYVLSNRQQTGQNSVIAIRYGAAGFDPLRLREYPTKGVGTSEAGMGAPTDGDQQIQVDRKRKLLFAVNQGSDTVAVFRILDDGGLEHVEGSPFPSGGIGPISVGLSDATVLVVNKGYDGSRKINDPGMVAQFQLGDDGSLTPKGTPIRVDPGTGPPQALVIDRSDIVVVPELITGPITTLLRRGTAPSGRTDHAVDRRAARARDARCARHSPSYSAAQTRSRRAAPGRSAQRPCRSTPRRTSCTPRSRR